MSVSTARPTFSSSCSRRVSESDWSARIACRRSASWRWKSIMVAMRSLTRTTMRSMSSVCAEAAPALRTSSRAMAGAKVATGRLIGSASFSSTRMLVGARMVAAVVEGEVLRVHHDIVLIGRFGQPLGEQGVAALAAQAVGDLSRDLGEDAVPRRQPLVETEEVPAVARLDRLAHLAGREAFHLQR